MAIAGLCCGFAGAILLARALAFESPEEYAQSWAARRTVGALGGLNANGDFAHVRDAVEARVGALLVSAGFLGQAIAAMRSEWSSTAGIVAYVIAAAVIAGNLLHCGPGVVTESAKCSSPSSLAAAMRGAAPGCTQSTSRRSHSAGRRRRISTSGWRSQRGEPDTSLAHRADYSRSASCRARARWLRRRGRCAVSLGWCSEG